MIISSLIAPPSKNLEFFCNHFNINVIPLSLDDLFTKQLTLEAMLTQYVARALITTNEEP